MSLAQLSRLLPLPDDELKQILDYASTLSKQEAADHFNGILGESPQSIEFISSFNSRRKDPFTPSYASSASISTGANAPTYTPGVSSTTSEVPKPSRRPKKSKPPLHTPAPRQIHNTTYASQGTAYQKRNEDDYITKKPGGQLALNNPPKTSTPPPRGPPSASGNLISDALLSKPHSAPTTRNSSPSRRSQPAAKITITGGTPMSGPSSSALSALDSAIRSLEISTNPTSASNTDPSARACNCIATRHPLLAAAPNCLNCGKVICAKEGLGPCTFCGTPLLDSNEVQAMIRELKEERGREKMALDKVVHSRAAVSRTPAPFSQPRSGGPTPSEMAKGASAADLAAQKAQEHRDRLLGFQAQNARRTTVRDEVADFETPDVGTSAWASPAERARQLKLQQKVLREQEWNARPEYEKRREVMSIDVVGGKVVRRLAKVERPKSPEVEDKGEDMYNGARQPLGETSGNLSGGKGAYSNNPLLGGLIKPVFTPPKGKQKEGDGNDGEEKKKSKWRRVQDDYDDNEEVILDGGAGGKSIIDRDY